jgi:hypothetical protein
VKPPKAAIRAVTDRVSGRQPNRWRASVTATAVGGAVGVGVYRVLRDR